MLLHRPNIMVPQYLPPYYHASSCHIPQLHFQPRPAIRTQHTQIYTLSLCQPLSLLILLFFLSSSLSLPNTQALLRFTTFLPKDQQSYRLCFGTGVWDSYRPALTGRASHEQQPPLAQTRPFGHSALYFLCDLSRLVPLPQPSLPSFLRA